MLEEVFILWYGDGGTGLSLFVVLRRLFKNLRVMIIVVQGNLLNEFLAFSWGGGCVRVWVCLEVFFQGSQFIGIEI